MSLPPAGWYNLVPASRGVIPRRAGTGLHLLAKEELLGGLIQARTGLLRKDSSASLYQLPEELFLDELVQARITPGRASTELYRTVPARSYSSASRYQPVPARRGAIHRLAGTNLYLIAEEWFLSKLVQACISSLGGTHVGAVLLPGFSNAL
ncbi:hypothetical protein PCASD_03596 [Puccinia coronata f. sp. avenae]|uniref:Uncharacterized protein n=1 Tax=Puccinia coronata f. sp. avenae TaxID=200324 RepID=A0A2N5VDI2_9BASI|nr:hypothetical protein PCASD_03596 [Puccinia coronata f. sp. avenae]